MKSTNLILIVFSVWFMYVSLKIIKFMDTTEIVKAEIAKQNLVLDSVSHVIDSVNGEVLELTVTRGRYETALFNLKSEDSVAASKFEKILNTIE